VTIASDADEGIGREATDIGRFGITVCGRQISRSS
jgi:hypothetical protein